MYFISVRKQAFTFNLNECPQKATFLAVRSARLLLFENISPDWTVLKFVNVVTFFVHRINALVGTSLYKGYPLVTTVDKLELLFGVYLK